MTAASANRKHYTNYCAYLDPNLGRERIGHYDEASQNIQPLAFSSGTYLSSLYEVIQIGEDGIIPTGETVPRSSVQLLPPISGRDILCVGKNYSEHAKEFNKSGFDSSDKVDQPTHPVIFTKRFTSLIADGEDILPHVKFTETLDYEGELGVIIGKPGFRIAEQDAMDYVWGYTIINDLTARERQRDHKQFFIGKSADTLCPMGPIAVPAHNLTKTLRVQTHVNGELRQDATTDDLIFSIPYLIKTISEGQTLLPGDVLATGTPAGVGIGRNPPTYLQPGDEISVSITGLGRLINRVASAKSENPTTSRFKKYTTPHAPSPPNQHHLTSIENKALNIRKTGPSTGRPAVFVHGLGGTADSWTPLLHASELESTHACYTFDLEGHGLSPTNPLSKLSIDSFTSNVKALCSHIGITSDLTLFAHSTGCLVALNFALKNPGLVTNLVLIGPPPSPLPESWINELQARAALVRASGMGAVVDSVVAAGLSEKTRTSTPLVSTAARLSLLGQDAEGYAKACTAFAETTETLAVERIQSKTLVVAGSEDPVSTMQTCEAFAAKIPNVVGVEVLEGVGQWHVFEDAIGVAKALEKIL